MRTLLAVVVIATTQVLLINGSPRHHGYYGGGGYQEGGYGGESGMDPYRGGSDYGGGNTAIINGGEFHHFGNIEGRKKRDTELSKIGGNRNKREITGENLDSDKRSKRRHSSEEDDDDDDDWTWYFSRKGGKHRGGYRGWYKYKDDDSDDLKQFKWGTYYGAGQGVGSLSDITGAKDHVINSGVYSHFGNILG